jgi:hypothetical protein
MQKWVNDYSRQFFAFSSATLIQGDQNGRLKMAEIAQIFLIHFSAEKKIFNTLDENSLGYVLGDFFRKLIWSPSCEVFSNGSNFFDDLEPTYVNMPT